MDAIIAFFIAHSGRKITLTYELYQ